MAVNRDVIGAIIGGSGAQSSRLEPASERALYENGQRVTEREVDDETDRILEKLTQLRIDFRAVMDRVEVRRDHIEQLLKQGPEA